MVCECDSGHRPILEDHNGALIVQNGALMDLQLGFQLAYLTIIHSNHFS
jgi:hypothetical protein